MTFEWDEAKNLQNVRKHGYSFEDAPQVFEGVYLELEDEREDYGELRYLVYGLLKGNLKSNVVVVCYTPRAGEVYRIISMRKGNKGETNSYYQNAGF